MAGVANTQLGDHQWRTQWGLRGLQPPHIGRVILCYTRQSTNHDISKNSVKYNVLS